MTDTRELVDELRHNAKCHFDGYPLARRVTGEHLSKAADTITALSERVRVVEAALLKASGALDDIWDGEPEYDDAGELAWCRNRAKEGCEAARAALAGGQG